MQLFGNHDDTATMVTQGGAGDSFVLPQRVLERHDAHHIHEVLVLLYNSSHAAAASRLGQPHNTRVRPTVSVHRFPLWLIPVLHTNIAGAHLIEGAR